MSPQDPITYRVQSVAGDDGVGPDGKRVFAWAMSEDEARKFARTIADGLKLDISDFEIEHVPEAATGKFVGSVNLLRGTIIPIQTFEEGGLSVPKTEQAKYKIAETMREFKRGELKSSSGDTVTDRKQALAIGLNKARET